MMSQADDIRDYVNSTYVQPARGQGQKRIEVRAGDIHNEMGLKQRMPAVCGALGSDKFEQECRVRRVAVEGPLNGANCVLIFDVLP